MSYTNLNSSADLDQPQHAHQSSIVRIQLTRGFDAIVDSADAAAIGGMSWHYFQTQQGMEYAKTRVGRGGAYMHRLLLNVVDATVQVDHINGNGLDNRRINLRIATSQQNHFNQRKTRGTSRFKGVSFRTDAGCWVAFIKINRRSRNLGLFDQEEAAARAYDFAAMRLFGRFAKLNFPDDIPIKPSAGRIRRRSSLAGVPREERADLRSQMAISVLNGTSITETAKIFDVSRWVVRKAVREAAASRQGRR